MGEHAHKFKGKSKEVAGKATGARRIERAEHANTARPCPHVMNDGVEAPGGIAQ